MEFKDKVVLITGASRGIGAATALAFAQKGAKVIVDYFVSEIEPDAEENAKKIIETIKTMGQEAIMIEADVRNEEQVKNIINKSVDSFGKIDILVNNAGIVFDENYESKTIEHWNNTLNTNLIGQFLTIKYANPHMPKGSKIINISSTNALNAFSPDSIDYDTSKAGIITLTKDFALRLAPNILVNAIAPGWVNTDMNKDLPKEFVEQETQKIWLKRFAEPEEISKFIMFLASDNNTFITGQTLIIDGGY